MTQVLYEGELVAQYYFLSNKLSGSYHWLLDSFLLEDVLFCTRESQVIAIIEGSVELHRTSLPDQLP